MSASLVGGYLCTGFWYCLKIDLKPGDKVRIDDTFLFKKGAENRWSDEVQAS